MRRHGLSILCVAVLIWSGVRLAAADVRGVVAEASGTKVRITIKGDVLPQAGDPVEISQEIPGTGIQAQVGTGKVVSAKDKTVYAEIDKKTAEIKAGQIAEIAASGAAKTESPKKGEPKKEEPKKTETLPTPEILPKIETLPGKELFAVTFADTPAELWTGTIAALKADGTVKAKPADASRNSKIGLGTFLAMTQATESKRRPPNLFPAQVIEVDEDATLLLKVGADAAQALERGASLSILVAAKLSAAQRALLPDWISGPAVQLVSASKQAANSVRIVAGDKGVVALIASKGEKGPTNGPAPGLTLTGKAVAVLKGHANGVSDAVFSKDGKHIVSRGFVRDLKVWDVHAAREILSLVGEDDIPRGAFSPDGQHIAIVGFEGVLKVYALGTPDAKPTIHELKALGKPDNNSRERPSVLFSHDGKLLYCGGKGGLACLRWSAQTGLSLLWSKQAFSNVHYLALSPDGAILAIMSHDMLRVLHAEDAREIFAVPFKDLYVDGGLQFSSDGKLLAANGILADKDLFSRFRVWDVESGKEITALPVLGVPSPDLRRFAGLDFSKKEPQRNFELLHWQSPTATWSRVMVLDGYRGNVLTALGLAFSPDGALLASSGGEKDHTVKIWDALTGKQLLTLAGHTNTLWKIAFSPDGQLLASPSSDRTIRLWRLSYTAAGDPATAKVEATKDKDEPKKDEPKKDEPKKEIDSKEKERDKGKEPPLKSEAQALFSDSFRRLDNQDPGQCDNALGGKGMFTYIPIFRGVKGPVGAKIFQNALFNNGYDYGGVQFYDSKEKSHHVGKNIYLRVENRERITQKQPLWDCVLAWRGPAVSGIVCHICLLSVVLPHPPGAISYGSAPWASAAWA